MKMVDYIYVQAFSFKIMKTMKQRYIYVYIEITKNCRLFITNNVKIH